MRCWTLGACVAVVAACGESSQGSNGGAKADAAPIDSGVHDSGSSGDDGSVCFPGSLGDFTPSYVPPVGPHAGACTSEQLTSLGSSCFATPADPSACNAWLETSTNAGCSRCWGWEQPVSDTTWGPYVTAMSDGGSELLFNLGGCIALADPMQVSCAKAVEAKLQCELAACLPTCGLPKDGDTTAVQHCYADADTRVCASYVSGLSVCESPDASTNPAAFCYSAQTLLNSLIEYLTLACGTKS